RWPGSSRGARSSARRAAAPTTGATSRNPARSSTPSARVSTAGRGRGSGRSRCASAGSNPEASPSRPPSRSETEDVARRIEVTRSTSSAAAALAFIALWLGASAVSAQVAKQLRIVKQPGLGYLQLIVMREQKLLDERLPGVEIEWRQLTS